MSFNLIASNLFLRKMLFVCLGLLFLPLAANAYAANKAEETELKAAFIYNFSLFATWPQTSPNLRLCILGADRYTALLSRYEGRIVQGATIHVEKVPSALEARNCQILFLDTEEQEIEAINKTLEGAPVLTVAESVKQNALSVMISLTQDNGRVAFEINNTASSTAGITLSSKLLKLARKVY